MADTFKPPEPASSPNTTSTRYLFIVIFIGFIMAVVFSMKPQFPARSVQSANAFGPMFWIPITVLGTCCLILGVILWLLLKRNFVMDQESNNAVALFQSGRLAEAEALFTKLLQKYNGTYIMKCNLAYVAIHRGQFEQASKLLEECSKVKQIPKLPLIPSACALLHAISSDLEIAEKVYDEALELTSPERSGTLAVPHALIAVRRNAYKLLAEMPEDEWFAAEIMPTNQMRCLRILRAYSLTKLPMTDATQSRLKEMLSGARPARLNEYNYLAARLPELRAFLIEQGFSTPQQVFASGGLKV